MKLDNRLLRKYEKYSSKLCNIFTKITGQRAVCVSQMTVEIPTEIDDIYKLVDVPTDVIYEESEGK